LTPVQHPATIAEERFNQAHGRTCYIVERSRTVETTFSLHQQVQWWPKAKPHQKLFCNSPQHCSQEKKKSSFQRRKFVPLEPMVRKILMMMILWTHIKAECILQEQKSENF